ncbi:MAG: Asp-tRNA(Asn)/Glu-tRNA(Gln) amidotransferase subunit GatC [Candidatus Diapherotrites archaeon]|uniref:Aspartyl/glutamyl-tRNA(Asn/Gln) amidotransferase subunit C n=1 Tax=Candidatus Iainarchaeum sp. TaxID=3101447 RepID=A0A8T3YHQ2_9ARCH|nr:Asp-tRNA(Asn)/Glu-tRNA(Gln) amidotransferase subunit GatC [Candidatus Diapherotrites archaeon]
MPKVDVNRELLLKVAANARLSLSGAEIKKFLPQLKAVLDTFSKLDEINVDGVEPSFQPVRLRNVFREDRVEGCLSQEDALSNTKHRKDGYFRGPRVV